MKIKVFLSQIYLLAPQLTVDELRACWYAEAWPLLIEFLNVYIYLFINYITADAHECSLHSPLSLFMYAGTTATLKHQP